MMLIRNIDSFINDMLARKRIAHVEINPEITDYVTSGLKSPKRRVKWIGKSDSMLAIGYPFIIADKVFGENGAISYTRTILDIGIPLIPLKWSEEHGVMFCVRADKYEVQ